MLVALPAVAASIQHPGLFQEMEVRMDMIKGHQELVAALRKSGDVIEVTRQVDWNLEAGLIARHINETGDRSALLTNIKDYPGARMHASPLSNYRRMAVAMELDPDTPPKKIIDEYERRVRRPIKPTLVKDGPCKENIVKGDDINLLQFPAPMVHDGDGGRYLATWHVVVSRDLEQRDWVNWGMYRCMVHNEKYLGLLTLPGQDIGRQYLKYQAANEPMPVAICIGPDPCSAAASTSSPGAGVSEADIAGAIAQEPIELVKCETVDLEVPAYSEIVIEGHLLPNVRVVEGPFGEYTGYRTSPRDPRPVVKVSAITYRNNPIVPIANMGTPVDECDILFSITWGMDVRQAVSKLPVAAVHIPPEACGHAAVVAVHKIYEGIAEHVANAIWGSKLGYLMPFVIVVDDDVDPYNWNEIIHAMFTKLHPQRSLHARHCTPGHGLYPFLSTYERKWGIASNLLIDLTWPIDWDKNIDVPQKASVRGMYPRGLAEKVVAGWKEYGF
ncbi:MAG: UbiD family decarboxylase [Clostridia bacterium]|nr:MAG: UbiD family decarboxylase [Clostridia bacterium]